MSLLSKIMGVFPGLNKTDAPETLESVKTKQGKQKPKLRCWPVTHRSLDKKLDQIIMTQKELATKLAELTAQEGKVAKEQSDRFDAVSAALKALQDSINSGDAPVSQEVTDNLASLSTAVQSLDDAIPDAPPTP